MFKALLLAAAVLVSLASQAFAQSLIVGVRAGPDSLDPAFSTPGPQIDASKHIYDPLVWVDDKLQLKPWLAESWKRVDDLTWEFKIRQGVKFHDGSELTAEDVKFTMDRVVAASGPHGAQYTVRNVAEVSTPEKYLLRIKTKQPVGILPYDFVNLYIVSHKIGPAARVPEFNSGAAAIGTGPYKLVSWKPKGDLVLARFDDYWAGKGPWEKVTRREIPNDATRLAALLSGQIDVMNYVSNADYETLKQNSAISLTKGDSLYVFWVVLDIRDKPVGVTAIDGSPLPKNPLQDVRVRTAIDLAIDRDSIASDVLEGVGRPAAKLAVETMFGQSKPAGPREYNPDKAKQLLADAGYPNGFKMDLKCTNDRYSGDSDVCAALAPMLDAIGIQTNSIAQPVAMAQPAFYSGKSGTIMLAVGAVTGEAGYLLNFAYRTHDLAKGTGPFNLFGYTNPEEDRLTAEGTAEIDDAKRSAIFEKAMDIAEADRPIIPITITQTVWAAKAGKVQFSPRLDEQTLAFFMHPGTAAGQ